MNFDCIILNPPYGSRVSGTSITLHYDITLEAIKHLTNNGQCICLMPTTLITSSTDTKAIKNFKSEYDKTLTLIEEIDGNKYFDTSMKSVGIYKFDSNKSTNSSIEIKTLSKSETVKSLSEFKYKISHTELKLLAKLKIGNFAERRQKFQTFISKKLFNDDSMKSFVHKFVETHDAYFNKYDIYVMFNAANGGMNAIWQNDTLKNIGIINKSEIEQALLINNCSMKSIIGFKLSERKSLENILKLIETNCLRYPLLKMQDDQNMCPRVYTYFPDIDYSTIDTEEKFYKFFNITPEEQNIITKTMEKYENK